MCIGRAERRIGYAGECNSDVTLWLLKNKWDTCGSWRANQKKQYVRRSWRANDDYVRMCGERWLVPTSSTMWKHFSSSHFSFPLPYPRSSTGCVSNERATETRRNGSMIGGQEASKQSRHERGIYTGRIPHLWRLVWAKKKNDVF